ncbi:MAG: DUF5134 domain-containing protein [Actinophytocola sp.]|uniref:DUF5134 domain-containing protein n=1 Tax=Actinophytocola sp. TaxID=1872138 RepID=UPI001328B14B|nr:DUF5134 domain-containing protein [Actinophytocola sp.]MPZ81079.1 DUF5134 domain-containing protein [Actinophytocola sp.]
MTAEVWLRWAGTAAFLAVAGYCVARLAAAHRAPAGYPGRHRAVDIAHVLMGIGMAAMASPAGGPLPMAGWQAIFLIMAAWFAGSWWRERRTGPPPRDGMGWHGTGLHHAVAALAMLYMLSAMRHGGGHGVPDTAPWLAGRLDSPGMALPVVGWALVGYFAVSAVLLVVGTDWRPGPAGVPSILLTPRITASCQATMALGNGYLLLAMLG